MPIKLRTKRPDNILKEIVKALEKYEAAHPKAKIETYRQNSVSIRIRIISPEFEGMIRTKREEALWAFLNELPEETAAEVSLVLLLTPHEPKHSFATAEFDDPITPKL